MEGQVKLQGEAEPIVRSAARTDDFQIIVRQGVMAQQSRFIRWQIEEDCPLAVRQDIASRHYGFQREGRGCP
jgi:hypothetical protein